MFLTKSGTLILSIIFTLSWLTGDAMGQLSLKVLTIKPNDPGDPAEQNQRIVTFLAHAVQTLEKNVEESLTRKMDNFYKVTGVLNRFRQNTKNLTNDLESSSKSIKTPEDLSSLLNSSDIVQNLNDLDSELNAVALDQQNLNNSQHHSFTLIWSQQIQLLTEIKKGIQIEGWAVTNLTGTLERFSQSLAHLAYKSGQSLNIEMKNLTREVGTGFLSDFKKKLDLTVPRRQPAAQVEKNEWNVTAELVIEKQEEGHDLRLKNLEEILKNQTTTLDTFIKDLESEPTISGFVERIVSNAEKLSGSKNSTNLHKLSSLVLLSSGKDEIEISENFGSTAEFPLKRQEWITAGFEKFGKFFRNKLSDIEQRDKDRQSWKGTQEYQRVQAERERLDRVIVGSYAITCKSSCVKDKDYYYCTNGSKWDYCSPNEQRDYKNKKCLDTCGHKGYGYKWCRVEGNSWGYCSTFMQN